MPTKSMKFRLNILVSIAFIVAIAWVVINLFSTSVTNSTEYRAKANSSQFRSVAIPAKRGSIYAADGEVLAQSATVYNIILDPTVYRNGNYTLEQTTALANKLNEMFGVDKEKFIRMTEVTGAGANYQKVATRVEKSAADKLTEYLIEQDISTYSLYTEQSTRRYYPQNELAASVIGFLNGDGDGVYGLEAYYDNYLAGVDGRIISARNAKGQEMPYKYERVFDAQDGNSVYLTIDTTLQYYAERELRNAVMTHNPENRACAIIMNCKTGAILAMATCPGFDLNNPAEIYDENTALLLEELKNNPETAALYDEEYAK
ncbi:MAG: peptidoglycan glycosyltransferase, partial [Oscillospiraceae bacterium]|nr:peptidoglycan glycosyltransferase [Oscillospiraceae bacterium]